MSLHDWADAAVISQTFLAATAAVIAFQTIRAASQENRKWKTLEVCGQYEFNERVAKASDTLRTAYKEWNNFIGDDQNAEKIRVDAMTILNFLDGIAIGVKQGLYIEYLAKDHLRKIVENHVSNLLDSTPQHKLRLVRNDYRFLVDMNQDWTRDKLYYREWRFFPFK